MLVLALIISRIDYGNSLLARMPGNIHDPWWDIDCQNNVVKMCKLGIKLSGNIYM